MILECRSNWGSFPLGNDDQTASNTRGHTETHVARQPPCGRQYEGRLTVRSHSRRLRISHTTLACTGLALAEEPEGGFAAFKETLRELWLFTLGRMGVRSSGGTLVAKIGPVPDVPAAASYVLDVNEVVGRLNARGLSLLRLFLVRNMYAHFGQPQPFSLRGFTLFGLESR